MTFSVITPSFKQLDWLRLAAASVRDQMENAGNEPRSMEYETGDGMSENKIRIPGALNNFSVEHIVQDAGSPGIQEFAQESGADFYRDGKLVSQSQTQIPNYSLKVYCEHDSGMYDAINRGLEKSSGEICSYLNCDEQYLPSALQFVVRWFEKKPTKAVLFADALLLDETGKALSYRRTVLPNRMHTRLCHLNTLTCSTFFRRLLIQQGHVFPVSKKIIGDAVWVDELLASGVPMGYLRLATAAFTFTGANLSEVDRGIGSEHFHWSKEAGAPPAWLRKPVSFWHRFKKGMAGAYLRRSFDYRVFTLDKPTERSIFHANRISCGWPGQT